MGVFLGQLDQGLNDFGVPTYEPPVLMSEADERPDIGDALGYRPVVELSNVARIGADTMARQDMT